MTYHSQFGQDQLVHETFFRDVRGGTFVEVGALDGLLDSNTLFFEQTLGWSGVLVEPNPAAYQAARRNRMGCAVELTAISDAAGTLPFEQINGPLYGWSGLRDDIEPQHRERIEAHVPAAQRAVIHVAVHDFGWLAAKHQLSHIDFVSIDTEGSEEKILQGFPWQTVRVGVFCIENNFKRSSIAALLQARGYTLHTRIGVDEIYYNRALFPELSAARSQSGGARIDAGE